MAYYDDFLAGRLAATSPGNPLLLRAFQGDLYAAEFLAAPVAQRYRYLTQNQFTQRMGATPLAAATALRSVVQGPYSNAPLTPEQTIQALSGMEPGFARAVAEQFGGIVTAWSQSMEDEDFGDKVTGVLNDVVESDYFIPAVFAALTFGAGGASLTSAGSSSFAEAGASVGSSAGAEAAATLAEASFVGPATGTVLEAGVQASGAVSAAAAGVGSPTVIGVAVGAGSFVDPFTGKLLGKVAGDVTLPASVVDAAQQAAGGVVAAGKTALLDSLSGNGATRSGGQATTATAPGGVNGILVAVGLALAVLFIGRMA